MSKWFTYVAWEECPHLSQRQIDDLYSTIPEYQREARSKGIPSLGSGLIYPIRESDIVVPNFPIPDHFKRVWGLDCGWEWTAVVWGAQDPDSKVVYLYDYHKRGKAEPSVHADAVKARGEWIPGVADAAEINKMDGRQLVAVYRDQFGLDVTLPIKAVEAGIYLVYTALTKGTLKIFESLTPWLAEYRTYARDEEGRVIKKNDHLMDATRYLMKSGLDRAITKPIVQVPEVRYVEPGSMALSWMG